MQLQRTTVEASAPAPGKRTLTETLAVQHKGGQGGQGGDADVHATASQGVAGPGGPLPHAGTIQRLFGPEHDVSGIRAHTDGAAQDAAARMGAVGYATGNDVAFAGAPDLHLAAHEAAHVVQQRAGVQLAGGVGASGDVHERNADEVADRVVAGQSAADLLPAGQGAGSQLQRKEAAAPARGADDAGEAREGDADDDLALDADEDEQESAASVVLAAGKPPGVQKKATSGQPAATASRRPRRLTIAEATARYAPLVFLAPGEDHRPSSASAFINNSSLRWSHDSGRRDHEIAGRGRVDENRLGSGGYEHQVEGVFSGHHGDHIRSSDDARPRDGSGDGGNEGFFLDLDNSKHESEGPGTNAPVYYEAVPGHYITYWFFYAYNAGPAPGGVDNHEGDWERIVVKLNRNNRATAVAYYQHNGHEVKPWRSVPRQGSHPLVFSAKGSHASYDSPGAKDLGVPLGAVKDHAGRGAQWRTWNHLQSARAQGWYGYGGAWGEVGNFDHTTGPRGPSRFKRPAPEGW